MRLDRDAGRWEKAGDAFAFPLDRKELTNGCWVGSLFQGCAVLHDDTILVSLRTDRGMLTFSCSDSTWTEVTTIKDQAAKETHTLHTPIQGVVYTSKQKMATTMIDLYFLRDNHTFAYKLCY
jgi:hypothetical protein